MRSRTIWIVAISVTVLVASSVAAGLVVVSRRPHTPPQVVPPMSQFVPDTVTGRQDIAYGSGDRETFDVWFPRGLAPEATLPVIVWVHGGGWIGGSKTDIAPYIQILASKGFTTIGVNYSLAPDQEYPGQVHQLNAALEYVKMHAAELHVDPDRILLAGDSGGAHIAAQLAAGVTDPAAAQRLDLTPSVDADQLAGLILACGAFDLGALTHDVGGIVKDYVDAYIGTTARDSALRKASVEVTPAFPSTWLSGGNADPLTPQVKDFAKALTSTGVEVDTMFWPKKQSPPLGHEYQFNLGLAESVKTLESAVAFARSRTGLPPA